MRVVIGGAHNGKRNFVKKYLHQVNVNNYFLFEGEIPEFDFTNDDTIVIANFEKLVLEYGHLREDEIVAILIGKVMDLDAKTNVICICTDIGRGIVPLDKNERKLRDTCGRLYQALFSQSEHVLRIWYGIPQVLKGEEWNHEK